MRSFILFLLRYYFVLLFIVLEALSFIFIINSSSHHNSKFFSSANYFAGNMYTAIDEIGQYLNLTEVNRALAIENRVLRSNLVSSYKANSISHKLATDTLYQQQYKYIEAKVINNSINRQRNYLTLNIGKNQGVAPDMAVISTNGVIGIVDDVSANFSTVISVLNVNYKVSAKFKKNGYFGSLAWDAKDYRFAELSEIPFHVKVYKGDTIVTNAYSSIYPEGILLGIVESYEKSKNDNFYTIKVKLATDFQNVDYVYVISDLLRTERLSLEKTIAND